MEPLVGLIQEQLADRRQKLVAAADQVTERAPIDALIHEVDAALERVAAGSYGLCEACHDPIETDRLLADPLLRFCLAHLSPSEQRALERDIEMATQIQAVLLPPRELRHGPWLATYRYRPARAVSGDYCDLLPAADARLDFALGDVAGKGIAASMIMTQLHTMFRTLISLDLPLEQVVERASRLLCESALPTQYATLVCGRLDRSGDLVLCNAGHPPALVVCADGDAVTQMEATGLPVGLFNTQAYSLAKATMAPGDTLVLYTDGVTESRGHDNGEYGLDRLLSVIEGHRRGAVSTMLDACLSDLVTHRGQAPVHDDITLMAIRREA